MRQPTEDSFLLYHHMGLGDFFQLTGLTRRMYSEVGCDCFYLMAKDIYA